MEEFKNNFISRIKGHYFSFDVIKTNIDTHIHYDLNQPTLLLSEQDYYKLYYNIEAYLDYIEENTDFNYFSVVEKENKNTTFLWIVAGMCTTKIRHIKILSEKWTKSDIEEYGKELDKNKSFDYLMKSFKE
jgi:hypothetical protein